MKKSVIIIVMLLIGINFTYGCIESNNEKEYYYQLYYSVYVESDEMVTYSILLPCSSNLSSLINNIKTQSGNANYSLINFNNSTVLKIIGTGDVDICFYKEYKKHPIFEFSLMNKKNNTANINTEIIPINSTIHLSWSFSDYYNHPRGMGWGYNLESQITNGSQFVKINDVSLY